MNLSADPRLRMSATFTPHNAADVRTLAECGARWQGESLVAGGLPVTFRPAPAGGLGTDGFRLQRARNGLVIEADTRVARLSALLSLPELEAAETAVLTRRLLFHRRVYKHEITRLRGTGHPIIPYTESFWSGLMREIVRRHFNGIALYTNQNPFEAFGDYGRYEAHAAVPAAVRAENRLHFTCFLETARRYGLETMLQQYIARVPGSLALTLGIPFYNPRKLTAEIADFHHPSLYAYLRDMYQDFFGQLPGLDRLMVNLETAPNSTDFCREVLIPALSALPRPPALLFRLWYMTNPAALCDHIEAYPGHCMVTHKVMDTMDVYASPAPDTRIREWKAIFAQRGLPVEWNYLVGPCHNCGSNISRRLWSDPEFVHTLMDRVRRIGSDGFNFHTLVELLANTFDSSAVIDDEERELARLNQGHLEATVDMVRGSRFDESAWVGREAQRLGLTRAQARQIVAVTRDSSRAEIMHLEQFPLTTHEGYAADARRQLSQHTLYHPPVNVLLNRQHREDPRAHWCFINKARAGAAYPEDLQTLIDYADPSQPKTARNPAVLAREMMRLGAGSLAAARRLKRVMGSRWVEEVAKNASLATVCGHDILAGISLFRVYFPASQAINLRAVDASIRHLEAIARLVRREGSPHVHMQEPFAPQPDIAALRRLRRHLSAGYPRKAFAAYVQSVKTYNDIRRHVRPWRIWSAATLKRAGRLLREARGLAADAVAAGGSGGRWEAPLREWLTYLDQELAWLQPPMLTCGGTWSGWQPLVHDNCFGYGGFAWADFLGFFESVPRDKGLQLDCSVRADGEALHVRLREQGVDGAVRLAGWRAMDGHADLAGVMRVFLDVAGDGRLLRQWSAIPAGPVVSRDLVCAGRQAFDLRAARLCEEASSTFAVIPEGWEATVRLPFTAIGANPPDRGRWLLNIASNAPVRPNHAVSWCKGYEVGPGNPIRLGTLQFGAVS